MAETVIEEIRQTRRAISDRFRGDIAAIAADVEARQAESGQPVWNPETPNKRAASARVPARWRYRPGEPARGGER